MFLKGFLCFRVLSFRSNWIFHVFFKNFFKGIFVRSLWQSASCNNRLRQNLKTQNSHRDFRDCLATVLRLKTSRKRFCTLDAFSQVTSWVCNPRKMCVFSFKGLMWQIFKHTLVSLIVPFSCLSQSETVFHSKTHYISSSITAK